MKEEKGKDKKDKKEKDKDKTDKKEKKGLFSHLGKEEKKKLDKPATPQEAITLNDASVFSFFLGIYVCVIQPLTLFAGGPEAEEAGAPRVEDGVLAGPVHATGEEGQGE